MNSLLAIPTTDPYNRFTPCPQEEERFQNGALSYSIEAAAPQPQSQQGVIQHFTNEGGEGFLSDWGRQDVLTYTGDIVAGKAEGRGTVRSEEGKWTLLGAKFHSGIMLPGRAVLTWDTGYAFAGPLAASGVPADGARGAFVRTLTVRTVEEGKEDPDKEFERGRFQGVWPTDGPIKNRWFFPRRGAAWVAKTDRVYAVALDGTEGIFSCAVLGDGWRAKAGGLGWVYLGVMKGPAGEAAFTGHDPLWAEAEHEAVFTYEDKRQFKGTFRGLCPLRGVLTDASGRQQHVEYSGDGWLTVETLEQVLQLARLAKDLVGTAARRLREMRVTAEQLRTGVVTDRDLERVLEDAAEAVAAKEHASKELTKEMTAHARAVAATIATWRA